MEEYINPIYACGEHIDMAIDDFLVDNETFPVLSKAEEGTCSYCSKPAEYVLTKKE
jgi:CxxH/CxxC protein (TIGR04129 family)